MLCLFGAVLLTFQLIRLAREGGCWGFGFQSQPGTSLICSCCDFMLHGLKHKHTWPMIYGPWQPELPPVGVCVHTFVAVCCLGLDDTELIHSEKNPTPLQNIWTCWQDQACDWTTRPQMTGLSEGWTTGGGRETFPVQQQTQLHFKMLLQH